MEQEQIQLLTQLMEYHGQVLEQAQLFLQRMDMILLITVVDLLLLVLVLIPLRIQMMV